MINRSLIGLLEIQKAMIIARRVYDDRKTPVSEQAYVNHTIAMGILNDIVASMAGGGVPTAHSGQVDNPSPELKTCEISDVSRDAWQAIFAAHFKYFEMRGIEKPYLPHDEIMEALRPYLRTTEPVTVKECSPYNPNPDCPLCKTIKRSENMAAYEVGQRYEDAHKNTEQPVDVIESVALALSQWVFGQDRGAPRLYQLPEALRKKYRDQAKAAIAAMPKREVEQPVGSTDWKAVAKRAISDFDKCYAELKEARVNKRESGEQK